MGQQGRVFIPIVVWATVLCWEVSPALATDPNLALKLGSVIGSEEFCGLSYDQEAIEAFIEKNVAANDMEFAPTLNTMVGGGEVENREMSPSEKTAHCTQTRRVAKSFGFTH